MQLFLDLTHNIRGGSRRAYISYFNVRLLISCMISGEVSEQVMADLTMKDLTTKKKKDYIDSRC